MSFCDCGYLLTSKTSLKMASLRTKHLKNKKEVQVKHLRKELAQLLESGQEQTAIIRVSAFPYCTYIFSAIAEILELHDLSNFFLIWVCILVGLAIKLHD